MLDVNDVDVCVRVMVMVLSVSCGMVVRGMRMGGAYVSSFKLA